MWKLFNSLFEAFKKFPLFKLLYKISWAPKVYHYSIALLGAVLYPFAGRGMHVIGITGTKGKTTTAELLNAMLEGAGHKTALLTSIGIKISDKREKNRIGNTMPGRFFVQQFLRRAKQAGCDTAIVEVTSEGAVLHRHRFISWSVGAITNIAPEHIESHGSFEAYREAKANFLAYVAKKGGTVFANEDDERSRYFFRSLPDDRLVGFSTQMLPDLPSNILEVLPGEFNKQNIAAATAIARSFGIEDKRIASALEQFSGIPGRMEYVQKDPFSVVVDYAHTPDSLEAAYDEVKSKSQKLICVLGSCGGGRDRWKRPELGRIAEGYCDKIFLTNEDPWGENPEQIVKQIAAGFSQMAPRQNAGMAANDLATNGPSTKLGVNKWQIVLDRAEAIRAATGEAQEGDVVIITGKGSEEVMRFGDRTIPWSDKGAVLKALGSTDESTRS